MAELASHSGARYPLVPLIVVKSPDCSRLMSFARPKSEILTPPTPWRRMFSGLTSQWTILRSQPEWR
ncbi:hypothetical protein IEQ34_017133 [Dendrobium chrysotoxum]|uniref:Uncharacterized protein n=1 Tax=Dendrobium chrysotoxum TaxID=161865 RepID=A0AAV7GAP7_DENCH|nr:hypothetical protein IEQ34_017133 [Dendrobium chrysotoxum]